MDPNTALAEMREAARAYWCAVDDGDQVEAARLAAIAIDAADSLDSWMSLRGDAPKAWHR